MRGSLLQLDGLVRADLLAGAALGAIVRAREDRGVLQVECAGRALVHADAAGRAEVRIDDGLRNGGFLSRVTPGGGNDSNDDTSHVKRLTCGFLADLVGDLFRAPEAEGVRAVRQDLRRRLLLQFCCFWWR